MVFVSGKSNKKINEQFLQQEKKMNNSTIVEIKWLQCLDTTLNIRITGLLYHSRDSYIISANMALNQNGKCKGDRVQLFAGSIIKGNLYAAVPCR